MIIPAESKRWTFDGDVTTIKVPMTTKLAKPSQEETTLSQEPKSEPVVFLEHVLEFDYVLKSTSLAILSPETTKSEGTDPIGPGAMSNITVPSRTKDSEKI